MNSIPATNKRTYIIMAAMTVVMLSPIWLVERFIVQDASGHINTSFVMGELLKGNKFFTDFYQFNSWFVPNSSGHWLMVLLLQFFSPFVVTKIMMSLTFIVVPASVVWLKRQILGSDGTITVFLIGCAIAFNWFWLLGTFNFLLGFAGCIFTVGLFWRWRDSMSFIRCCVIVLLLAFVYFSHLIGFMILTGSIFLLAIFVKTETRKHTIAWTVPILFAAIALLVMYKVEIGSGGESFSPVWRSLTEPFALQSWINQLIAIDPFVLLSRRTLPFTNFDSPFLAVFSPILWVLSAFGMLFIVTYFFDKGEQKNNYAKLPFAILSGGLMLAALIGPDDFNLTNGGLLRQRLFMAALAFIVPLFRFDISSKSKFVAQSLLFFVLIFQTAVMWDFSLQSNAKTRDFAEASSSIPDGQRVASIVIIEDNVRFHALPTTQMINYLGISRNLIVVDNYEMGHNLFPVVTRDTEMRKFILGLTNSNIIYVSDRREDFTGDLKDLDFYLSDNFGKIDIVLFYGRNEAVEVVLCKTFEPKPFYQSDKIRLFQRSK